MGWDDDRAVSEVLGAMLLFGILVLAIGGYQAFVVPHQNEQVEQRHDMQVNDEFPNIQTSISNAAGSGEPRTTSITLGTDYPFQVFSVRMSPPTGNIKTGEPGNPSVSGNATGPDFSLRETCGLDPETRSIQYRANYHEYDNSGRFVYENGVTYREVDGNVVVRNDQELIDGNIITLYPMTNGSFDRTSSASEQLRFNPGRTGMRSVRFENDSTLSIPTELNEDHWVSILDGEVDQSRVNVSDGMLNLTLKEDRLYWFRCTPVGVNEQPDHQGSVPRDDLPAEDQPDFSINPRGTLFLSDSNISDSTATVTFQNDGDEEWTITQARIPFVLANGDPTYADVDGNSADRLFIGDSYDPITNATIGTTGSDATHTMTLEFDDTLMNPGGGENEGGGQPQFDPIVVLSLRLESGERVAFQTYFVTDTS